MTTLIARTGETIDGLPVSVNAVPPADLAPFVARFFVTIIDQPDDQVTQDILLNETALVRVPVRGDWEMKVRGRWTAFGAHPVIFGAQRQAMAVRGRGPMAVAGFAIRPSGWFGFFEESAQDHADRASEIHGHWGDALMRACADIDDHRATVERLVEVARARIAQTGGGPDAAMAAFEERAWREPGTPVTRAAAEAGLTQSQFDRRVRAHFGHLAKVVLRRSRFLDMAAVMRGMAIPGLDGDASARFYDASHLNREFRLFVDMTPAQFARAQTPLMTPGIEVRQRRKLDYFASLPPGARAPWLAKRRD